MKKSIVLLTLASSIGLVEAADISAPFNSDIGMLVSDEVLGAQRGKFVAGPKNHYFGIEFITSIAGPNGTIMTSGMQLNVNFNHNQPTVSVNHYGDEGSLSTGSAQNSINNAPNGSGVVQIAQIAGNGNAGLNDLSFMSGQMQVKGSSLTQGQYQLSLPDGLVRYDFNNSGLAMSYASNDGNLTTTQMLRDSNGSKGFVQQFSIADNSKLLSNQAKFYMGDQLNAYTDLAETLRQQLPTGIR
ncbi:hypothetical protein [Oceanisphaera sp. W20_SRM_FM3]|uniref:hypothetical protein n=1 Tax=Oceanisphaera sp. W20_SRM_FM3 TaxID=3240267 RepID=UPI003F9E3397